MSSAFGLGVVSCLGRLAPRTMQALSDCQRCLETHTALCEMLVHLQDPFKRAEIWLRHRKDAKVEASAIWKSLLVSVDTL